MVSTLYETTLPPLDIDLEARPETPEPVWHRVVGGLAAWLSAHRLDVELVFVLALTGGLVHALGMNTSPARFDDEGTYTAYAWAVSHLGSLGHYTYWYAHPPLGWMQISLWTTLTDGFHRAPYAVAAAREFMLVCKLVSIVLLYALARRLGIGRVGSVLGVAIFAFSPLAVYFTRAALLDNIVTPWLIGAFLFASSPRRSVAAAVGSAVTFSMAVLTKETALLYLPALLVLLWQNSDRRNRRFGLSLFLVWFVLICAAYPLYALIKNELLQGPGHVSMEWAVRWQLFGRTGSGSIFNHDSTAYAVIRSWYDQDRWLPYLVLVLTVPGLLIRRTRVVALAFTIQVVQLLRGGYLPYPYVIAMIPFAALTVGGVVDRLTEVGRARRGSGEEELDGSRRTARRMPTVGLRRTWQTVLAVVLLSLTWTIGQAWSVPLSDLRTVNRDQGKAQALEWILANVKTTDYIVVDDSFWVDLVRAGYPRSHVIWFTKLDVDKDVKLPGVPQWTSINYVVLDRQDDLSLHVQVDGAPSKETAVLFPTLGRALAHAKPVARFGVGLDGISVRQIDPGVKAGKSPSASTHESSSRPSTGERAP